MAWHLITTLLSLGNSLLPSIKASAQAPSSSSNSNSENERRSFEENLEKLMRTLERIKATLYDAEEREITDRSVKLWLKELKKVAYAAEDVFSEYRYEATRVQVEATKAFDQTSGSHKRKQMDYIVPIPDGMVGRLNKIQNQFDEIAKDREALQLRETDGARRKNYNILPPPTSHMVDEASIFGRGGEIEDVISFLLSDKENPFSVISIVGKGGLGKTTIAQLVYKDRRVCQSFDLLGWICVSEEFDVSRLTKATIESVFKKNCGLSELSPLQEELAKAVKEKSVLLVLDDVWNENESLWELFRVPLKEAKLVRILATTRNDKVAKVMHTMACFRPRYLPENSSWKLFKHYAFGNTSYTMSTNLIEMGRKIMRKCGGLPLAVKSIASLLRHEADEESWKEILECDLWESNPWNEIFPALQISYAHLPAHLKPCFLFCSMYPKDYELEEMNLIELWISHGYVEPKGRKGITEIGVEYFEELKGRSFLDEFSEGISEHCKLHDIIHDLARLNSENEHFSMNIDQPLDIFEGNILRKPYHLYATGSVGYINEIPRQNLKALRTLITNLCFDNQFCSKFEALRALELKEHGLKEIPDSISLLKHLSYLRIKSGSLARLPSSIGLLFNLQTFILDCDTSPLIYLPDSIGDLANLRCLRIVSTKLEKLPESLCSLTNLLRLSIACDKLEKIPSDIRKLCNLQELIIYSKLNEAFPDTIGCLSNLEQLQLPFMAKPELSGTLGNCCKLKTLKTHGCSLNYNPHILKNFPSMRSMVACLRVRTIAWLKEMKDLEGDLMIDGLEKISNLLDAQLANLRSKCKIETLYLRWCKDDKHYHYHECNKLTIKLTKNSDKGGLVGGDMSFGLLECLQPHKHLKELVLDGYPSPTLPHWIGNQSSMQSVQEIRLQGCDGLRSLPFSDLHTLKRIQILSCPGVRVVQLPSHLEELKIFSCAELELITGLWNLKMFATQNITEPFGNSSHEKPCDGWQTTSSLKEVVIKDCPLPHAMPPEFVDSTGSFSSLEKVSMGALRFPRALEYCRKLQTLEICGCVVNYNPNSLKSFPAMRSMVACLRVKTIAWLKDMNDLESDLRIERLENTSNLVDAHLANLKSKGKIRTLYLCWYNNDDEHYHIHGHRLTIEIIRDSDEDRLVGENINFELLKCLQPHTDLKKLVLECYPSATLPGWMGDPLSLQAIREIILQGCGGLQSLLFSNLHSLKELRVSECSGIQLLPLEQLPSQLNQLRIICCDKLELITGLRVLKQLDALEIGYCEALESIRMDKQQLVESTEKSHDGQQSNSPLKWLYIWDCSQFHAVPHELLSSPSGDCYVWVDGCGCPNLKFEKPFERELSTE